MKQTGIVDRFEGDDVVVEIGGKMVNFPRTDAPAMLGEGMVVIIRDDRIAEIDQIETQRLEDDMRRRFERILGKQFDE
ncbi:MAG TPA: DUF3006 domain-containing protein [Candidatus Agathobaculum pullicola]|uniref:DUF3006 domain-containing protein n=1 Tax=Candidatus Agathobaculum pullicola TaxID=2838426 RepID=UPI001F9D44B8|nr:DUF3006 domain-containing protein [Candidatus Agathobaculum pullicola]